MAKKRPKQEEPAKLTGSQDLTARQLRAVIDRYQAPGGQRRWNPNGTTFEEGQVLLKKALHCVGLDPDATLFTSRDPVAQELKKILKTSNVPEGFEKWQLPFSLYEPSNVFLSQGEPYAKVPTHWHAHGAGYRVILQGSITLGEGTELTTGDWMYVPKAHPYSFEVGAKGVLMVAGYAC
jgi:hypothetical protein